MSVPMPPRSWIVGLLALPSAVACGHVCLEVPQSERGEFLSGAPRRAGYVIGVGDEFRVEVWENASSRGR